MLAACRLGVIHVFTFDDLKCESVTVKSYFPTPARISPGMYVTWGSRSRALPPRFSPNPHFCNPPLPPPPLFSFHLLPLFVSCPPPSLCSRVRLRGAPSRSGTIPETFPDEDRKIVRKRGRIRCPGFLFSPKITFTFLRICSFLLTLNLFI